MHFLLFLAPLICIPVLASDTVKLDDGMALYHDATTISDMVRVQVPTLATGSAKDWCLVQIKPVEYGSTTVAVDNESGKIVGKIAYDSVTEKPMNIPKNARTATAQEYDGSWRIVDGLGQKWNVPEGKYHWLQFGKSPFRHEFDTDEVRWTPFFGQKKV